MAVRGYRIVLKSAVSGAVFLSILLLLAPFHWALDMLSHFRLPFAVGLLLLLLLLFVYRAPRIPIVACCLLLQLIPLSRHYMPTFQKPEGVGSSLKIVSFNLFVDNRDFQEITDFITSEDPDVVCFQEYGRSLARGLSDLKKAYPYSKAYPASYRGLLILSKLPMKDAKVHHDKTLGNPYMTATLDWNGQPLSILNAHPSPPMSKELATQLHNTLSHLKDLTSKQTHPSIVLGDFNCTAYSPSFKLLGSELIDSSRGRGYVATWQRGNPLLSIPIDQMLHTEDLVCTSRKIGPKTGSDHSPIIAIFQKRNL